MKRSCNLQVEVNGEEIFLVSKKILTHFSCKFSKMFAKSRGNTDHLKVILHEFPGGPEGFELILRYCYNNGKIEINSTNILSLHCAEHFMGMMKNISGIHNLTDQMEQYLEEIPFWTWSQSLSSLKQCQDLYAVIDSRFLEKYLDFFISRLYYLNISSLYTSSSSEISNSQALSDASSDSVKSYSYQATWYQDFSFVHIDLFTKLVRAMISQGFDHKTVFNFIVWYRRWNFVNAEANKKLKIVEIVIDLLFLLDRSLNSRKEIFEMFRVALCLKISKNCKKKLEALVGSKLDEATIDDLLVPSPRGKQYMYDVNMIVRLLGIFFKENNLPKYRVNKISDLLILYLMEVAPDPKLKPCKFVKLATEVSKVGSDSHNKIYLAIDIYLKVHRSLCKEEKMKMLSMMNKCRIKITSAHTPYAL